MKRTPTIGVFCLVIVALLSACASGGAATQAALPATNPAPPSLPTWTPPAGPSATPVPPLPESLTTYELHERLNPFTHPECPLPCYNGLTPGQTGLTGALDFYARLGISVLDMVPGDYESAQDGTGRLGASLTRTSDVLSGIQQGLLPPRVDLYLENDTVLYIYVQWEYYPDYVSVQQVIQMMGQPDRLELALVFGESGTVYVLQMVYSSRQTGFAYVGQTVSAGLNVMACFGEDRVRSAVMGVFAPQAVPMDGLSHQPYLLPVEQALGLGYADFAAQMNSGGCLTLTPEQVDQWRGLGP